MPERNGRAFLRGVGSVMDLGGTTYKRTPLRFVKKGSLASDRAALARDSAAVLRRLDAERNAAIRRYNDEVRRYNAEVRRYNAVMRRIEARNRPKDEPGNRGD